jgi:CheY-like chemotaxis protein
MMNLCINSSQAMEETGGVLDILVETTSLNEKTSARYPDLTPGGWLMITVSDTGPGINPDIIDRIFDPYFTTKAVGKGSGMGLAVVHGIVKNHHGTIFVESKPGKGTSFTIFFPLVTEQPVAGVKASGVIPRGAGEKILFVDDEASITEMIGMMLERLGYKVQTTTSPVDALELFRTKPDGFDLVLTDMTMPKMTGVRLSEKLKEIRRDIPVVICTGYSAVIDEEKAESIGIDGFVMKPIEMSDIAKTIHHILDVTKSTIQG